MAVIKKAKFHIGSQKERDILATKGWSGKGGGVIADFRLPISDLCAGRVNQLKAEARILAKSAIGNDQADY
jgi:hypothetical protein